MSRPDEKDIEEVRKELEEYYGTAMMEMPMAVMDLARVSSMSDEEVIAEAKKKKII